MTDGRTRKLRFRLMLHDTGSGRISLRLICASHIVPAESVPYTYYLDGNIASENENGTTKTYEYDGLGRLTKETRNGTITVYTYDTNGNLINDFF